MAVATLYVHGHGPLTVPQLPAGVGADVFTDSTAVPNVLRPLQGVEDVDQVMAAVIELKAKIVELNAKVSEVRILIDGVLSLICENVVESGPQGENFIPGTFEIIKGKHRHTSCRKETEWQKVRKKGARIEPFFVIVLSHAPKQSIIRLRISISCLR